MNHTLEQQKKAIDFRRLHEFGKILILPNAWDAVSAKIFETEGFKAIGTTSAGISASLGYPDGQRMSLLENIEVVKRIVNNSSLPVSVDIEAGYSENIEGVVESAKAALDAGAVGINIEDSTGIDSNPFFDISIQCKKISKIRKLADNKNIDLFINARTDIFLFAHVDYHTKIDLTIERAKAYKNAGADCIFVPDMGDLKSKTISLLVSAIKAPLNIIAGANTPSLSELHEMGVARVSLGPKPMRAMLQLLKNIGQEIINEGTFSQMNNSEITYSEVNSWFSQH